MAMEPAITILDVNNAHAETDREHALEERVKALEQTVQMLLDKETKHHPSKSPKKIENTQTKSPTIQTKTIEPVPDEKYQPLPQPGTNVDKDEPVQELNVLRNNTVTLKPKGSEISTEVDYISKETSLQRDRAIISNTSIRYGILDWLELSANIPFGYTSRTTNLTPTTASVYHTHGLG